MDTNSKGTNSMFKRQELSNHCDNFVRDIEERQQMNEELSEILFKDRQEKRRTPSQTLHEGVDSNEQLLGMDINSNVFNFSMAEEVGQN